MRTQAEVVGPRVDGFRGGAGGAKVQEAPPHVVARRHPPQPLQPLAVLVERRLELLLLLPHPLPKGLRALVRLRQVRLHREHLAVRRLSVRGALRPLGLHLRTERAQLLGLPVARGNSSTFVAAWGELLRPGQASKLLRLRPGLRGSGTSPRTHQAGQMGRCRPTG